MGRKTFDSVLARINKPLPERQNIVLTRRQYVTFEGITVVPGWEEAINTATGEEVFVIGGAQIYALALPYAQRLYLTEVATDAESDTFFPEFDPAEWRLISEEAHHADEKNPFDYNFKIYERNLR